MSSCNSSSLIMRMLATVETTLVINKTNHRLIREMAAATTGGTTTKSEVRNSDKAVDSSIALIVAIMASIKEAIVDRTLMATKERRWVALNRDQAIAINGMATMTTSATRRRTCNSSSSLTMQVWELESSPWLIALPVT